MVRQATLEARDEAARAAQDESGEESASESSESEGSEWLPDQASDGGSDGGSDGSDDSDWDEEDLLDSLGIADSTKAKAVRAAVRGLARSLGVKVSCLRKLSALYSRLECAIAPDDGHRFRPSVLARLLHTSPPLPGRVVHEIRAFCEKLASDLDTEELRRTIGEAAAPLFAVQGGSLVEALKNVPGMLAFALIAQGCHRAQDVRKKAASGQGPAYLALLQVLSDHGLDPHAAPALAAASAPPDAEDVAGKGAAAAAAAHEALSQKEPDQLLKCLILRIVDLLEDVPQHLSWLFPAAHTYAIMRNSAFVSKALDTANKTGLAFVKLELLALPGDTRVATSLGVAPNMADFAPRPLNCQDRCFRALAQGFSSSPVSDDSPDAIYAIFRDATGFGAAGLPPQNASVLRAKIAKLRADWPGIEFAVLSRRNGAPHIIKCAAEAKLSPRVFGRAAAPKGYMVKVHDANVDTALPGLFSDQYVYDPALWHVFLIVLPHGDHPIGGAAGGVVDTDETLANAKRELKRKRGFDPEAPDEDLRRPVLAKVEVSGRSKAPEWHASRNPSRGALKRRREQRAKWLAA